MELVYFGSKFLGLLIKRNSFDIKTLTGAKPLLSQWTNLVVVFTVAVVQLFNQTFGWSFLCSFWFLKKVGFESGFCCCSFWLSGLVVACLINFLLPFTDCVSQSVLHLTSRIFTLHKSDIFNKIAITTKTYWSPAESEWAGHFCCPPISIEMYAPRTVDFSSMPGNSESDLMD